MSDQTEIPEVPPVGRLKLLRAALPPAERIIRFAKSVETNDLGDNGPGVVAKPDASAVAPMRRATERRMDALGLPIKRVEKAADFPEGTRKVAAASKHFWEALEVGMSAILGVSVAENALLPPPPGLG